MSGHMHGARSHESSKIYRIAICGRAGAGKTTLANALSDEIKLRTGKAASIVGFADKLKDVCREIFRMESKDRELLQGVGTALRSIRDTVWIDYLMDNHVTGKTEPIIVHDVRYENEALRLLSAGFVLVHLHVDRKIQIDRGRITGHDHDSESSTDELIKYAHMHARSSTPEDLKRLVNMALQSVRTVAAMQGPSMHWEYGVVS